MANTIRAGMIPCIIPPTKVLITAEMRELQITEVIDMKPTQTSCTVWFRKSSNSPIDLHCLILPKWVSLMT